MPANALSLLLTAVILGLLSTIVLTDLLPLWLAIPLMAAGTIIVVCWAHNW
jgi:hypothetical protein